MKVIERGKLQNIKCKLCNSVLEYELSDIMIEHKIKILDIVGNDYTYNYDVQFIICPICERRIYI